MSNLIFTIIHSYITECEKSLKIHSVLCFFTRSYSILTNVFIIFIDVLTDTLRPLYASSYRMQRENI